MINEEKLIQALNEEKWTLYMDEHHLGVVEYQPVEAVDMESLMRVIQEQAKGDGWIPVKSGEMPEEMETVQVTYLCLLDGKPHCDLFAYIKNGRWYIPDRVVGQITAWRRTGIPYMEDADA